MNKGFVDPVTILVVGLMAGFIYWVSSNAYLALGLGACAMIFDRLQN